MPRGGKRDGAGRPPVVDDPAEFLAVALRCERIQEESKIDRVRLVPVRVAKNKKIAKNKKKEKDLRKLPAAFAPPVPVDTLEFLTENLDLMMIGRDERDPKHRSLISEESRQMRRAIIEAADSDSPLEGSDEFCDAVEALRNIRTELEGGDGLGTDADGKERKPSGRFFRYAPARPKTRADICTEVATYFTKKWGKEIKPSWVDDCWKEYRANIATDDGWLAE